MKRGHIFKETYRVEEEMSGSKTAFKVSHLTLKTFFVVELLVDLTGVDSLEYDERQVKKKNFAIQQERLARFAANPIHGLARLVDFFEEEEKFFSVRDWVEGLTLRKLVEESLKPLDQATCEDFGHQLLGVVEALNQLDPPLVLGTICPDYLVANPQGKLTIIDFGLAARVDGDTEFEAFSCPELLGGSELDVRSDLYSIGALLYFCITGMEVPPIWDRITLKDSIATPLELDVKASAAFWTTLERMLSLNLVQRPQTVSEARALFAETNFKETPESSPATWYPEQSELLLADSYPFQPMAQDDWVLKMVQAAVLGRARHLAVIQNREACCFEFRFAAPDVPAPKAVLEALTSDAPITDPVVSALACGLRTIGEFRDFRLTLDDWRQSWTLVCRGGSVTTKAGDTQGSSGLFLKVVYRGKSADRAAQSAEELIRLVRKTRLCSVPITIGRKPLEPGRGTEISELSDRVAELYLLSASIPQEGLAKIVSRPEQEAGSETPLVVFEPDGDASKSCHIDVRCYVEPGEGFFSKNFQTGYSFLRRPSRVLWYRHGVLCGQRKLDKALPLQLDIHLNGDHLVSDNSGLKVDLPHWLQASQLKPVLELHRMLPITRLKLEEFWKENPAESSPKAQGVASAVGIPLFLSATLAVINPVLLIKKAAAVALVKGSAVAGGAAGYLSAASEEEAVRKACIKAIEAFAVEDF